MTVALLFLIEATTTCGPAAPARLGGGAEVVRAVLDFEDEGPETSVVTLTGVSRSIGAAPAVAELETHDPSSDPAPTRCEPAPVTVA